jgi:hypothetical protein
MLTLYVDEMTGDHQCGLRCNMSTTNQIPCIRQKLEKGMITVIYIYRLQDCLRLRREVLCN